MSERDKLSDLFNRALTLPTEERQAFLDDACRDDDLLRAEVESLLTAYKQAPTFFEQLADEVSPLAFPIQPPERPDSLIDRTVSHYQILERLGGGGMGVVYKARHLKLDRLAALKFLPPHMSSDEAAKQRLLREAQAASNLDHVNIGTIYDIGETDDAQLFIAMAYYPGGTLKALIANGRVSIEASVNYIRQIAEGLAAAHRTGIIHRDIKPANVLVTEGSGKTPFGLVKVVDFGIAKVAAQRNLTRSGATLGTVAYMSPEQIRNEDLDGRTDLWSLGVLWYELLTGSRPFDGAYQQALMYAITNEEPAPLRTRRPEAPEAIETILRKLLAKDRAERYKRAEALLADLNMLKPTPSAPKRATELSQSTTGTRTEGERLLATVVSATLIGYLDLVDTLDPVYLDETMGKLRHTFEDIAHRHEGVVHSFKEEEFVLLFGVPTPHENDPMRAVAAVLDLQTQLKTFNLTLRNRTGYDLQLTAGIDTGRLVVTHQTGGLRVTGTPLRIAMQLSNVAEAGRLLVSEATHRLVSSFFKTKEAEPLRQRGRREAVRSFRVLQARGHQDRIDASREKGLSAFTGRMSELERLQRCFDVVLMGDGQFVSISGEAGIGKSRMLYEFERTLPEDTGWIGRGRCPSYGGNVAFLPFIEVTRQILGITEGRVEVEPLAERIRSVDPALAAYIPFFLRLFSLESDTYRMPPLIEGDNVRLALMESLVTLITMHASHQPVVLLLEDWHWSDEASREVLNHLVELIPSYPLMIIVSYRPNFSPNWGHPDHHIPVRLRPLPAVSTSALAASAVGVSKIPDSLAGHLYERTGGNPLFLEEMCRNLIEEGTLQITEDGAALTDAVDSLKLPTTVEAVLQTRLHRLEPGARSALQLASVIGYEFSQDLLAHIRPDDPLLTRSLAQLKSAGLIQQIRILPQAVYRFKHALTQEAAYNSLLQHQRKTLHRKVGESIEFLYEDQKDEYLERLTHHFSIAEIWEKVAVYGQETAQRAWTMLDYDGAYERLKKVQASLGRAQSALFSGRTRKQAIIDILLLQDRLCEALAEYEQQEKIQSTLLENLNPDEDQELLAEVLTRKGDLLTNQGRHDEALHVLNKALTSFQDLDNDLGRRHAQLSIGYIYWRQNRYEDVLPLLEDILAIDRQLDQREMLIHDLHSFGTIMKNMGDMERARDIWAEAVSYLDETVATDHVLESWFHYSIGTAHHRLGDIEKAHDHFQKALDLNDQLETIHLGLWRTSRPALNHTAMAQLHFEMGNYEGYLQQHKLAVQSALQSFKWTSQDVLPVALQGLGSAYMMLNQPDEALPRLRRSAEEFENIHHFNSAIDMWRLAATACEQIGNMPGAIVAWERVLTLCRKTGRTEPVLDALEGKAKAVRNQGRDTAVVIALYEEALAEAETRDEPARQAALHNTLGILHWKQETYGKALMHYETALELYRKLKDDVHAGVILNSLGVTLHRLDRLGGAIAHLEEALELHRKTGEHKLEAYALTALGDIYYDQQAYSKALTAYGDSLQIRWDLNDRPGEGWMLHHLARVHAALGESDRVQSYLEQAQEIATACNDTRLQAACRRLAGF